MEDIESNENPSIVLIENKKIKEKIEKIEEKNSKNSKNSLNIFHWWILP